jgi:long-chain acyl-CoA synthetase
VGNNIIASIVENIGSHGSDEAVRFKRTHGESWLSYTWDELAELITKTSKALIAAGVMPQENVAIFSQNKVEWSIADLGIMGTGAVSVPVYATNTTDQANYIVDEAGIKVIFVGDQEQYDKALEMYANSSSTLEKIVVLEDDVILNNEASIHFAEFLESGKQISNEECTSRLTAIDGEDLATIIYTSGTPVNQKG